MPNDTISKSNSSSNSMPPPPKKKQRKENHDISAPVKIAAAPPVSLPPPIMPYHPHLVPSYYPVYPQHPYFLAVQPPVSPSLSPTLSCTNSPTSKATTANNNKSTNVVTSQSPSALTPSYPIYPYPLQLSPQMHPNNSSTPLSHRHNSISSTGTTADEREQARKVSHSAIERRRRERINDKIMQLKDLIPSCAERDNLHKMTILQSAIDYIGYLKGLVNGLDDKKTSTGGSSSSSHLPEFQINMQQQSKSMLPKEAEKFTSQFSIERRVTESSKTKKKRQNEEGDEEEEEEEDDDDDDDDVVVIEDEQQQQQQQQQNENRKQKQRQEYEDGWSNGSSPLSLIANEKKMPVPVTSLKPMDVMGLSSHTSTPPPPKIVVDIQDSHVPPITDRNMNLENILC